MSIQSNRIKLKDIILRCQRNLNKSLDNIMIPSITKMRKISTNPHQLTSNHKHNHKHNNRKESSNELKISSKKIIFPQLIKRINNSFSPTNASQSKLYNNSYNSSRQYQYTQSETSTYQQMIRARQKFQEHRRIIVLRQIAVDNLKKRAAFLKEVKRRKGKQRKQTS